MNVSIIIPVYNTGERLRRCLESVIGQTFKDYECLVVDDGSSDISPSIIDEYAKKDGRIKSICKKNGGVSSARNLGLNMATGEWIVFLDSDDELDSKHLENMLVVANDNVDAVFTGYVDLRQANRKDTHSYLNQYYEGKEAIKKFLTQTDVLGYMIPWDKMFRRSLIEKHHIRFDEKLALSEDRLFCYQYLLHINAIATISSITYIHDASDMNSLSYRHYPTSINAIRYQVFVKPTELLVSHYEMNSDEACGLWKYLWSLMELTICSMYSPKRCIFSVSRQQRKFFTNNFCQGFYEFVKENAEIQSFLQTPGRQLILEEKFFRLNLKFLLRHLLNKLHWSKK